MITFTGPLKVWTNGEGRLHFINVPESVSAEIKGQALTVRRGFGSVRVEATIGDLVWRTSVFPQRSGGYFLPVKMEMVRNAGIRPGDDVTVTLALL